MHVYSKSQYNALVCEHMHSLSSQPGARKAKNLLNEHKVESKLPIIAQALSAAFLS